MTFNDRTTPLSLLATRRSGKPRDLIAPGPDAAALDEILTIAARTPDHGKLAPWRFVIVDDADRAALAGVITGAYRAERPQASRSEIESLEQFAHQAPALVVVLFSPRTESHIPLWEQELSAGAASMNLLHAALAARHPPLGQATRPDRARPRFLSAGDDPGDRGAHARSRQARAVAVCGRG